MSKKLSKNVSKSYGNSMIAITSMLMTIEAMATPAAPAAPVSSTFGTPLLSVGLGGLLTSMGLSPDAAGAVASGLMVAIVAGAGLFVYRMVKNKDTPANRNLPKSNPQPQPAAKPVQKAQPAPAAKAAPNPVPKPAPRPAPPPPPPAPKWGGPTDFDMDTFLRQSKSSFVRMQAAWDKADTTDLQKFTTPQVFAELSVQVQAKGPSTDQTEVVSIAAELLGIDTMGDHYLASVKFTGMIKSTPTAMAEPFAEVWNLAKPLDGSSGWLLAGIQQLS